MVCCLLIVLVRRRYTSIVVSLLLVRLFVVYVLVAIVYGFGLVCFVDCGS